MTLGQRIAELRRQHDLSQEELGEQMGVSRQAISKWESDAAVPEVDKLIALSRLFSVPVGVLLGVETSPEPSSGQGAAEDAPASPQEELITRALEQYSAATHRQLRRLKFNLACGMVIAFFLCSCFIFNNLRWLMHLQEQFTALTEQITVLRGDNTPGEGDHTAGSIQDHNVSSAQGKLLLPDRTERTIQLFTGVLPTQPEEGAAGDGRSADRPPLS